jgi:hypothetical protein
MLPLFSEECPQLRLLLMIKHLLPPLLFPAIVACCCPWLLFQAAADIQSRQLTAPAGLACTTGVAHLWSCCSVKAAASK